MLPVLSQKSIRHLEKIAEETFHIPESLLMENAAFQTLLQILFLFGRDLENDLQAKKSTHSDQPNQLTDNYFKTLQGRRILVCCGIGNNGGDGAAVARHCLSAGANVTLLYSGSGQEILNLRAQRDFSPERSGISRAQQNILSFRELAVSCPYTASFYALLDQVDAAVEDQFERLRDNKWDIIVDAIYGIGFRSEQKEKSSPEKAGKSETHRLLQFLANISHRNQQTCHRFKEEVFRNEKNGENPKKMPPPVASEAFILALDLPSGLSCDNPFADSVSECIVQADQTICFGSPKPSNVLWPARQWNGKCTLVPIGLPQLLLERPRSEFFIIQEEMAGDFLRQTNLLLGLTKRDRGCIGIFAGSSLYPGAALLAANSCYSAGAGMVRLSVPESIETQIRSELLPEIILDNWGSENVIDLHDSVVAEDQPCLGVNQQQQQKQKQKIEQNHVLLIGCGLGTQEKAGELLNRLFQSFSGLIILDADALNSLAPLRTAVWRKEQPIIITPHFGEFQRLLGKKISKREALAEAISFATRHQIFLLLKGENTFVVHPQGKAAILPFSVDSMGRAGSGDVLSGLIASFLGQMLAQTNSKKLDGPTNFRMGNPAFEDQIWHGLAAALYIAGKTAIRVGLRVGRRFLRPDDIRLQLKETCAEILESRLPRL